MRSEEAIKVALEHVREHPRLDEYCHYFGKKLSEMTIKDVLQWVLGESDEYKRFEQRKKEIPKWIVVK